MACISDTLTKKGLIRPPGFMKTNVHYEVVMGSVAYGVSSDMSDMDIYGFCIPPKDMVFPHLAGEIPGFGRQIKRFEQFQQHHINDPDSEKEYDVTIYSIVKYFQLCMENNPNMIDSLFVPQRCVIHCTQIGNLLRENRKLFLHKKSFHTFKGYAYAQLHKMRSKHNISREIFQFEEDNNISHDISIQEAEERYFQDTVEFRKYIKNLNMLYENHYKRADQVRKVGLDFKFAYHVVRLLNEVEQIMIEGDLDLERNREQLKAIRRGEWTFEQLTSYFDTKERELESVYSQSTIPYGPDEDRIKQLLLNCLEHHFGSLDSVIKTSTADENLLVDLQRLVEKYGR